MLDVPDLAPYHCMIARASSGWRTKWRMLAGKPIVNAVSKVVLRAAVGELAEFYDL